MMPTNTLFLYGYDWSGLMGRPQQISRGLAKRGTVLYVETPISFLAALSQPRRFMRFFGGTRKIEQNLFVLTLPLLLPLSTVFPFVLEINSRICAGLIRKQARSLFKDYVILAYSPIALHLLDSLDNAPVFYDCADDHAAWSSSKRNRRQIEVDEPKLAARANANFVVSNALRDRFLPINKHTYKVPNGVQIDHFTDAARPQPLPLDLTGIKRPIIGFIGTITPLVDIELIEAVARARPQWSILIVGPLQAKIVAPNLDNVYFLGKKPYSQLPAYLGAFDVCILPWNKSRAAIGANPAKLFQYLASGKPVVTVDLPEIAPYSEVVYISEDTERFIRNIELALEEDDGTMRQRRIAIAEANTWDHRTETLIQLMGEHYHTKNLHCF